MLSPSLSLSAADSALKQRPHSHVLASQQHNERHSQLPSPPGRCLRSPASQGLLRCKSCKAGHGHSPAQRTSSLHISQRGSPYWTPTGSAPAASRKVALSLAAPGRYDDQMATANLLPEERLAQARREANDAATCGTAHTGCAYTILRARSPPDAPHAPSLHLGPVSAFPISSA